MGDTRSVENQMKRKTQRGKNGTDLVYNWLMFCAIENGLKVLGSEVADADALELSLIFQVFENFP